MAERVRKWVDLNERGTLSLKLRQEWGSFDFGETKAATKPRSTRTTTPRRDPIVQDAASGQAPGV
jgi:hypothetical protein